MTGQLDLDEMLALAGKVQVWRGAIANYQGRLDGLSISIKAWIPPTRGCNTAHYDLCVQDANYTLGCESGSTDERVIALYDAAKSNFEENQGPEMERALARARQLI